MDWRTLVRTDRPLPKRAWAVLSFTIAMALVAGGSLLPLGSAAKDHPPPGMREAHYTDGGSETCLRCHGGDRMTSMAQTPHGNTENPHTPASQKGCESCHGPGSVHSSRAGGGRGFPPLVTFGPGEDRAPQLEACLNCHAQDMGELAGMAWTGSLHDQAGLACMDCHEGHAVDAELADRDAQSESCAMCHGKQIADHPRFEDAGIVFDELTCYTCHDVHQLIASD